MRYILDNSSKSENEKDLLKTLDLSTISLEEAEAGLDLLDEWKSEQKTKDEYKTKAASRWKEATIFKS